MKVLLLGVGAVGEAYAVLGKRRDPKGEWLEQLVLADFDLARAREVQARLGDQKRFPAEHIDVTYKDQVVALAQKYHVDLIINGCAQVFNQTIFDGAFEVGCDYLDMAMTLSEKHPTEPYSKVGVMLGDYQFAKQKDWQDKGLLALLGMGVEPGISQVFAKYAEKHLFDKIEEIGIRDGSNLTVEGYNFAPNFSIWSVIEECLNPPIFWEKERGWYTSKPFSEPEVFDFPEGIGPVEVVCIEHEEVVTIPQWINKGLKKVTFKFGLGTETIKILKTIDKLGLTNKEKINVRGVRVAPRDVVEACLPDPAKLGHLMRGKTCAGTWVKGFKENKPREVYIYQVMDNQECMNEFNCQAVAVQTAIGPIVATELLTKDIWKGTGVLPPEAFAPEVFMELMCDYGFTYGIRDKWQD